MNLIEPDRPNLSFVPPACTLPTGEQPLRVVEFAQFFAATVSAVTRESATVLRLALDGDHTMLARARDLAAREVECCSFFDFTVDEAVGGGRLRVEVPSAHVGVLDGLQALAATAARDRCPG